MPWFGKDWGADCCEEDEQIPVPVGSICYHCEEAISIGDNGFQDQMFSGTAMEKVFIHLECKLRTIVGSASHLLKKCSCYGGDWEDPPELSKREAARLAAEI